MKKRTLTVCVAMLIAVISCVSVWAAGYTCSSCGGSVYTTGCTGSRFSENPTMDNVTCASHAGCKQTIYFFGSEMECMDCGSSYSGPGAGHAEYADHSSNGQRYYLCNY